MIKTLEESLSEAKFKKVESAVRQDVVEKYGDGNPLFEKLLEITVNNWLVNSLLFHHSRSGVSPRSMSARRHDIIFFHQIKKSPIINRGL